MLVRGIDLPSSKNYVRDYKTEYKVSQSSPEQKKNRAARNKARAHAVAKQGEAALKGKHVDHKVPLRSGGSTKDSNTRVRSASSNMSDNGHSKKK